MADLRIARWLGLCFLLVYLPFFHGHFFGTDELSVFEATRSLYEEGNLVVKSKTPHHVKGTDGNLYSFFGPAQSTFAIPFYGLGSLMGETFPEAWLTAIRGRTGDGRQIDSLGSPEVFAVALYSPVASALLVALFFLSERRLGVSTRNAAIAAALLGATTYVATMSVYFLRHTTEALTVLGGLYFLLDWKQRGELRSLALGCLLASLTMLVRVPAAVAVPPVAAYALWSILRHPAARKRTLTWLAAALPVLAVAGTRVLLNHLQWGTWIASPMLDQREHFITPFYVGAFGFLLSPGASIFLYSPLLLLLPSMLPHFWRAHRAECAVLVASPVCLLVFCSSFYLWTGLWSAPGPRLLFLATPLLMLMLGPWLDTKPKRPMIVWVGALAAAGGVIQLLLMTARWSTVIETMGYKPFAPLMAFVFLPDYSPVLGHFRVLIDGQVDSWLWGLWRGWPGVPAHPVAAATLALALTTSLAVALRGLLRSLAAEEAGSRKNAL